MSIGTPPRVDTTGMTWDELEAAGLDDCGLPLALCPGAPAPRPLGRTPKAAGDDVSDWLGRPRVARKRPRRTLVQVERSTAAMRALYGLKGKGRPAVATEGLTPRQSQILAMATAGATSGQIAARLGTGRHAIEVQMTRIRRKGHVIPYTQAHAERARLEALRS